MNCESVKKILLEEDHHNSQDSELVEHIQNCPECKAFSAEVIAANAVLGKLKTSKPILDEPELLTSRILHQIRNEQVEQDETQHSLMDTVSNWFLVRKVRLALYLVIVLFPGVYLYEEATALKSVVVLEDNLNNAGLRYEASFSDNLPNLSFFYDAYKLITGEKKHIGLSKEWMVVNKTFLKQMLVEYNSLTPERKREVDELRKSLTKEQNEFLDELMNVKKKEKF